MIKFITQHRRGKTAEWETSEIIPQEGEIVLEELSDKTFKMKIGDGVKTFNELPYADASVVSAIQHTDLRIDGIVSAQGMDLNTVQTEVVDMRTIDGVQFATAGNAVRKVNDDLKNLSNSLADFKDAEAVDGLLYKDNMLYLVNAEGETVGNGVKIIGGTGGGGGGSAYSTLSVTYVTPAKYVISTSDKDPSIKFKFYGTDSSNDSIAEATATWRVDGVVVKYGTVYGNNPEDASDFNTFPLKDLIDTSKIKVGTNKLQLQVRDDSGAIVTKNWTIQLVDIRVEFAELFSGVFNAGEEGWIDYVPHGAVNKTVVFILHNPDGTTDKYERKVPAAFSGVKLSSQVSSRSHGSYLLEMHVKGEVEGEVEGSTIESEKVFKDLVWFDPLAGSPVIAVATQNIEMSVTDVKNIEFDVYHSSNGPIDVTIYDNKVELKKLQLSDTRHGVFDYQPSVEGYHELIFKCEGTEKIIHVTVNALDIDISDESTSLAFDFNPVGKSNDDRDRLWQDGSVSMEVSNNFDWINGGYRLDDNGLKYFCVKAGTTATIKYKLFGDDAKSKGKHFKTIFKTTNVTQSDSSFLKCIDNTTKSMPVGINMFIHEANIYDGNNSPLNLAYSEEDIIEFEFNISSRSETPSMIMGYEDGVSTRAKVYDIDSAKFIQDMKEDIVIGSPYCDVHVYRMKAYTSSLTSSEIKDNFIRDARTQSEKQDRYIRNKIYDENGQLTPASLANACPWLRVYTIEAPHFTYDKENKVTGTTISQIYKDGDPILDNWTCYNARHSGQGTTSNNYGAAGRNLDFIMDDSGVIGTTPEFVLGDGQTKVSKITLTRTSVPVDYLNAKVNIASSNNLTNALLAKRYNEFNPYKRPFVRTDGTPISYIKDTMEFYNCAIFIRETDETIDDAGNYVKHTEFNDCDCHFYAIGNVGDSKKTDNTRLTDPSDPYECCVEIIDINTPLYTFPVDTMHNVMNEYTTIESTGERNYKWVKNKNRHILYEKDNNGKYFLTDQTADVDYTKTYYVDILLHDDFNKNYTYDWRYISNKNDSDIVSYCKDKWIEFYKFVTTSSDDDFKSHLKDYFVVESALFYYLFTTRYCMVDNRAKNTFWHYSISGKFDADGNQEFDENGNPVVDCDAQGNPIRRWDLCWDYDNDTALGLNNYGRQVYRYGLEDIDKDENNQEVFRASLSTFFCRIRDLFPDELARMYREIEKDSRAPWSANTFITECDAWQEQFPEDLWRVDIERKYIRSYTQSFIDKQGVHRFLEEMCNGRMKYQRRQWERSQEKYMQSKYKTTLASKDFLEIRGTTPSDSSVAANYDITLIPDAYMYLNVQYGEAEPVSARVAPGEPKTLAYSDQSIDPIHIWSSSLIRDAGDLSTTYPQSLDLSKAVKLRSLTLGNNTNGYVNSVLPSLPKVLNPLLESINIQNITGLSGNLDVSELILLKSFYAHGTNLSDVSFAEGGRLVHAELPKSLTQLTLKNLDYLDTDGIILEEDNQGNEDYSKISYLTCVNCPKIDGFELRRKCTNLTRAKITGLDISEISYADFDSYFNDLTDVYDTTAAADLSGEVTFEELTGTQYDSLVKKYPKLNINFKKLTCTVTFITPNNDPHTAPVTTYNNNFGSINDPVLNGDIKRPEKVSDASYSYTYADGWSTERDASEVDIDILKNISADLTLYPVFNKTAKKYTIQFYSGTEFVHGEELMYNETSTYNEEPIKRDTNHPDLFVFKGWSPKPENIKGNMICYAQYELNKSKIENIDLNGVEYRKNDATATLTIEKYPTESTKTIFKIPNSVNIGGKDYNVTKIYSGAFRNCNIEYVEFSEGLSEIGVDAFANNTRMTEVTIPTTLTSLGDECFKNCSIEHIEYNAEDCKITVSGKDCLGPFSSVTSQFKVNIGQYVNKIPPHLFKGTHCNEVTFSDNCNVSLIGDYAFSKSKLTEFVCPTSVKKIGKSCFKDCGDIETFIADGGSLETIESDAFNNCKKLKEVSIKNGNLISIGSAAFAKTSKEITFSFGKTLPFEWVVCSNVEGESAVSDGGILLDTSNKKLLLGTCSHLTEEDYPEKDITSFDSYAFFETSLTELFIAENVSLIGAHAFDSCNDLSEVTFDENSKLSKIGDMSFYKCKNLTEISLPEKLLSIGSYCFSQSDISELIIPDSVQSLGTSVFNDCFNLERIEFLRDASVHVGTVDPNTPPILFGGCASLTEVRCGTWIDKYKEYIPLGADSKDIFKYEDGTPVVSI
jgi:hypothetical protein